MGGRNRTLPGFEDKQIAELDEAAEFYRRQMLARKRAGEKEVDAKNALIEVMKKHKRDVYRDMHHDPPLVVTLVPGKDGVKVAEQEEDSPADDFVEEGAAEKKKPARKPRKKKAAKGEPEATF